MSIPPTDPIQGEHVPNTAGGAVMTADALPGPADTGTGDDDWTHYFCDCDPDVGMCGADLTGLEELDEDDGSPDCELCVVLLEATAGVCGRCGK
jgi:hypothetical protein